MATQAWALLRVTDVSVHLAFYSERLGWRVGERPAAGLCFVTDHTGGALLLVGPGAGDVAVYLEPGAIEKRPGDTLGFPEDDLDARLAELQRRGGAETSLVETLWRARELHVAAPDGYSFVFHQRAALSDDEALALYLSAPDALDAALADLDADALDRSPAPGSWSPRQLAHHIVDGDNLWAMPIKAALAAPGCAFEQDWYDTNNGSAETLRFASLPLPPALALFRANRAYIAALMGNLPDAWERSVRFARAARPEPYTLTPRFLIRMQAEHALRHVAEIQGLRARS